MLQLELKPETEAELAAQAEAHGVGIDEYVERLVRDAKPPQEKRKRRLTLQEFRAALDSLSEGVPDNPLLRSSTFDRAMIYADHD